MATRRIRRPNGERREGLERREQLQDGAVLHNVASAGHAAAGRVKRRSAGTFGPRVGQARHEPAQDLPVQARTGSENGLCFPAGCVARAGGFVLGVSSLERGIDERRDLIEEASEVRARLDGSEILPLLGRLAEILEDPHADHGPGEAIGDRSVGGEARGAALGIAVQQAVPDAAGDRQARRKAVGSEERYVDDVGVIQGLMAVRARDPTGGEEPKLPRQRPEDQMPGRVAGRYSVERVSPGELIPEPGGIVGGDSGAAVHAENMRKGIRGTSGAGDAGGVVATATLIDEERVLVIGLRGELIDEPVHRGCEGVALKGLPAAPDAKLVRRTGRVVADIAVTYRQTQPRIECIADSGGDAREDLHVIPTVTGGVVDEVHGGRERAESPRPVEQQCEPGPEDAPEVLFRPGRGQEKVVGVFFTQVKGRMEFERRTADGRDGGGEGAGERRYWRTCDPWSTGDGERRRDIGLGRWRRHWRCPWGNRCPRRSPRGHRRLARLNRE